LTIDAQRIAEDHHTGTSILAAVSRHLAVRHAAILRDIALITRTCQVLQPRLTWLLQQARANRDSEAREALAALSHGLQQIAFLSSRIADAYERDRLPEQLEKAMKSAQEIAAQFDEASRQLARDLEELELATEALI
jgi:chromosome segregation ATPase